MWAWIGVFLTASFAVTLPAGHGAVTAQARRLRHDRGRWHRLGARAGLARRPPRPDHDHDRCDGHLGHCAATVGLLFGGDPGWLIAVCLVWGISIVADSAQFSASIAELADRSRVGTMLTVQTALGFTLTLVTIHLMPLFRRRRRLALRVPAAGRRAGRSASGRWPGCGRTRRSVRLAGGRR